eukprot:GDKH01003310.1.p1 GENE.GDKH01003310.1~~GDKH01003310.1.p1  ORF type:complete len:181 (-),score=23.53 GDKH01003310.1:98-640(-)
MMKRFGPDEISTQNQMKSSVQRSLRTKVLECFPRLEPVIDEIIPKKCNLIQAKCANHITVALLDNVPLFFQYRDGPWVPTLRLLHQYPTMMPRMQVDRGGIKFVIKGANIMCPGLTSKGGRMEDVPADTVVQLVAEGKEHACAVGVTTMSTADIRAVNKDVCITNYHHLGDGLWSRPTLD